MYTPIIAPSDLNTNIYPEILDEITRADGGTLASQAIQLAIEEAQAYLSRYDLVAMFGDPAKDISATVPSAFLNGLVKDIAAWQLICLANPNIDYAHLKTRYEYTIGNLKRIQKGEMVPQGWILLDTSVNPIPKGDAVQYSSNPKRKNHF